MSKKLISKRGLKAELGIPYSGAHISRLEAKGDFPKRLRLGQNRVAWVEEEVRDWIESKIALRDVTF